MKYKKYILFQFEGDNPGGGLWDMTNDLDDLEKLKRYAKKYEKEFNEIINRDTWESIWEC